MSPRCYPLGAAAFLLLPEPRVTDLLVFRLAEQRYALPVPDVAEVVPRASLARLPGAPDSILGMLRLRGALLPVVDLRTSLGLPPLSPRIGQCIIVTRSAPAGIGFVVDGVVGLIACAPRRKGAGHVVSAVQETAGQLITILDPQAAIGSKVRKYLDAIGTAS